MFDCTCNTQNSLLLNQHYGDYAPPEKCRLKVFENRVLRRIFGPKRDKVTGERRKLHNDDEFDSVHPVV